jgi:hypothetical protein
MVTTLGPIGLASSNPYTDDAAVVAEEARRVESLGFSTLWRSGNLPMLDAAVRATASIPVATGIIPVDSVPTADVIATYRSLQRDHPGRFIVGLGGAHGARPLETLNAYSTRWTPRVWPPTPGCWPRSARTCWRWRGTGPAAPIRFW